MACSWQRVVGCIIGLKYQFNKACGRLSPVVGMSHKERKKNNRREGNEWWRRPVAKGTCVILLYKETNTERQWDSHHCEERESWMELMSFVWDQPVTSAENQKFRETTGTACFETEYRWGKVRVSLLGYRFKDSHTYTMYVTVREWGSAGIRERKTG